MSNTRKLVDLDARAAARRQARGEPPLITFRGQDYELPRVMTVDLAEELAAEPGPRELIRLLFGEEQAGRFFAADPVPDLDDILVLGEVLEEWAGASLGEQGRSSDSSPSGGASSNQTSAAATGSASLMPATAPTPAAFSPSGN